MSPAAEVARADLDASAEELGDLLAHVPGIKTRPVLAHVIACARSRGWSTDASRVVAAQVAGEIVGCTADDLAWAARSGARIVDPWPQMRAWADDGRRAKDPDWGGGDKTADLFRLKLLDAADFEG